MQAISNGHNGQYITPEPICGMMTTMIIGDTLYDGQTICDPSCGSGRMLLAAAKINRRTLFYGADLDITCCKMTLVNMLVNSLTVRLPINILSNQFFTGHKVQTTLVGGYHMPYYTEFTDTALSYICLHDLKGNEVKSAFSTPFEPVTASQPISGVQTSLF